MTTSPPPRRRKRGRGSDPDVTRAELLDAAFATVRDEGFRGASARAIAAAAGQNQAAIYYHFGNIDRLLVAALTRSSERRLERYRAELGELADDGDLATLVDRLTALHREDRDCGHLAVLSELLGGITAAPELRAGVQAAIVPWLEFVATTVRSFASTHPLGSLVPAADLTDLVFSVVVGSELRNRLDGSVDRGERQLRLAEVAASILTAQSDPAR